MLRGAIASSNYNASYDFNRDGVINATDVQILGSNYGFTANRAPVVTSTSVLTHTDLSTSIVLDKLATDPEGDRIFYRIINPVNGAVTFTPDGHSAFFVATAGYSGTASFEVVGDDGFSSSAPAKVTVNVISEERSHGNVFSWYAGTADLAIDEVDNGYTQRS